VKPVLQFVEKKLEGFLNYISSLA